jgi:hypothetical protein
VDVDTFRRPLPGAVGLRNGALVGALLALLAAVQLYPGLVLGISGDAAVFALFGQRLLTGGAPYLDVWDQKPPGIYVIDAGLGSLPIPLWPAIWLASVAVVAATGWMVYRLLADRHGGSAATIIAALAVLTLGVFPVSVGGGMTETFAAGLAAGALLSAARSRWIAAGLLSAAAVATSLLLLPVVPAILCLAGRRWRIQLLVGFGGAVVLVPLAAWLAAAGAAAAAWDQIVTYNRAYAAALSSNQLPRVVGIFVAPLPLVMLVVVRGWREWPVLDRAALLWLALGAALLAYQGRTYEHYLAAIVVPLAILAGPAAARLRRDWRARWLLTASLAFTLTWGFVASADAIRHHDGPLQHALGEIAAANSSPGDRILVWGSGAAVYLAAERTPATRYVHWVALITPGYSSAGQVAAWVAELEREPPQVIVDAVAPQDYPASCGPFRTPSAGDPTGRTLDLLAPFRAFVAARYQFATEVDGRTVYRLAP